MKESFKEYIDNIMNDMACSAGHIFTDDEIISYIHKRENYIAECYATSLDVSTVSSKLYGDMIDINKK